MRGSNWQPPSRRRPRKLGACEITHHALDSYLSRHAEATRQGGREALERLAREAVFIGRRPTGEEVYRADGCRLIVHRPARRPAVVLTVLPRAES